MADSQASTLVGSDNGSMFDSEGTTAQVSEAGTYGLSELGTEDVEAAATSNLTEKLADLNVNNQHDAPSLNRSSLFRKGLLRPFKSVQIEFLQIPKYKDYDNTSVTNIPVLIYHNCFRTSKDANMPELLEDHLKQVNAAVPAWRHQLYSTDHCHIEDHEVLLVYHGTAKICLGGTTNPDAYIVKVSPGDVLFIPPGVAHCRITDNSNGVMMVGAYVKGRTFDMHYGRRDDGGGPEKRAEKIRALKWFPTCPIYGPLGAVYPWQIEGCDPAFLENLEGKFTGKEVKIVEGQLMEMVAGDEEGVVGEPGVEAPQQTPLQKVGEWLGELGSK